MTKQVGRPKLKKELKRVEMRITVSPATIKALDSQEEARGRVIDELVSKHLKGENHANDKQ